MMQVAFERGRGAVHSTLCLPGTLLLGVDCGLVSVD
jgi:hypothetical protein